MAMKPKETLTKIVKTIYGSCLSRGGPVSYNAMTPEERAAVIFGYELEIDKDVEAILELVAEARRQGAAEVYNHIRKADSIDADDLDEVMNSSLELGDQPIKV